MQDCATVCAEFCDWPNSYRRAGEVRRCAHGRVWEWTGGSGYSYSRFGWIRLHPWWDRKRLRRAEAALVIPPEQPTDD